MKIGTRGSDLALWQARHVRALLQQVCGIEAELVIIHTSGDKDLDTPFVGMTGKGFFTKEIEDALLAGQIDLAVHSLKDLQTVMPDGLTLAAVPERADRRDLLLIRNNAFAQDRFLRLKSGAKVGRDGLPSYASCDPIWTFIRSGEMCRRGCASCGRGNTTRSLPHRQGWTVWDWI